MWIIIDKHGNHHDLPGAKTRHDAETEMRAWYTLEEIADAETEVIDDADVEG